MPTGYTCRVQEGNITELKDYILLCARNFGGFIHMRDDNLNDEIRLREESNYHQKQLDEYTKQLKELQDKSDDELQDEIQLYISDENKRRAECLVAKIEYKKRYNSMLEKVKQWEIPSDDYKELKKFSINQLEESIKWDCRDSEYDNPITDIPSVQQWRENKIESCLSSIKYHSEKLLEEKQDVKEVNNWITSLLSSLE